HRSVASGNRRTSPQWSHFSLHQKPNGSPAKPSVSQVASVRRNVMNRKMKAAQIGKPGGDWELVERDIPEPGVGQVRVKVKACGICHSDVLVKDGLWPGIQYPR